MQEKTWKIFGNVSTKQINQEIEKNGGSGIGLAFVKAIMSHYNNDYGVINHKNGVEFYFDLDKGEKE